MGVLHTINKSPFEAPTLPTCLRLLQPGSAILFYEDGIYCTVANTQVAGEVEGALEHTSVYCLEPDLSARGFSAKDLVEGVELVSYDGFVALAVQHNPIQAW